MKVYYSAKLDTEAGKKADEYFAKATENKNRLYELMRENGYEIDRTYSSIDTGEVRAFTLKGGKPDEGWIYPRHSSGYFPKRIKKNMPLIKEIAKLRLTGNAGYCKAIFGGAPLIFRGVALIRGVAGGIVGDRAVVIFHDQQHADELRDHKYIKWPKGFRRIKESSYYAMKEAEDKAA